VLLSFGWWGVSRRRCRRTGRQDKALQVWRHARLANLLRRPAWSAQQRVRGSWSGKTRGGREAWRRGRRRVQTQAAPPRRAPRSQPHVRARRPAIQNTELADADGRIRRNEGARYEGARYKGARYKGASCAPRSHLSDCVLGESKA